MKKILFILISISLILSSCEDEETITPNNNNNNNGTTSTSIVDVWNLDSVYYWGKASYYTNFPSGQVILEEGFSGWTVSNGYFASDIDEMPGDGLENILSQSWEFLQNGQMVINTVDAVCGYSSTTDLTYSITNNNQLDSDALYDMVGIIEYPKFNIDALTPTSLVLSDIDSLTPNFGSGNDTFHQEQHYFYKFSRN